MRLALLNIVAALLFCQTAAIRFYVKPNSKKCLKEEIHKNVVVTGSYEFFEMPGYMNSVHVSFCPSYALFMYCAVVTATV